MDSEETNYDREVRLSVALGQPLNIGSIGSARNDKVNSVM